MCGEIPLETRKAYEMIAIYDLRIFLTIKRDTRLLLQAMQ